MFELLKLFIILISLQYIRSEFELSHEKCGTFSTTEDMKKWVANVEYNERDNKCFAIIINEKWLISAASCFWDYNKPENYKIKFPQCSYCQNTVDKIVRSPKYNPTRGAGYDIALIKLQTELQFDNRDVLPICLPDWGLEYKSKYSPNSKCYLIRRINGSKELETIESNQSSLINHKNCAKIYDDFGIEINEKLMVCVGPDIRARKGDTAAPLMCQDEGAKDKDDHNVNAMMLYGIASWVQPDSSTKLDVFTKLYQNDYIQWIKQTINAKN